jgi:hypothetical protein
LRIVESPSEPWRSRVIIAIACVVVVIVVFTAGAYGAGH